MSIILPYINHIAPYPQGSQPTNARKAIKLNQNESPYPPSPKVAEALAHTGGDSLNRYPDAMSQQLRRELARVYGARPEQIVCGNGSSELISLLYKVCIGRGRRIAVPDPSFALYYTAAQVSQAECVKVPARDDFTIDVERLIESGAHAVALVNPNAPTGLLTSRPQVERLVSSFPGLVIIDEAYMDFAGEQHSVIPLVQSYPNLVVLRTFSKAYALSGARIGCCFADESIIEALTKTKDLFNVNSVSQRIALAALQDQQYMKRNAGRISRTREAFCRELLQMGFTFPSSQTNFVLCCPPKGNGLPNAREIYRKLMEKEIYVRYFAAPRLNDKLRISIGTETEMQTLLDELRRIISGNKENLLL